MYLFKNRFSVYFVRVCTPKALVQQGFPFDFKFSLKTKSRPVAIRRSQPLIMQILKSLDNVDISRDCVRETKAEIAHAIGVLRNAFNDSGIDISSVLLTTHSESSSATKLRQDYAQGFQWQKQFIETKRESKITHLTVHQLDTRTTRFLNYLKNKKTPIGRLSASVLLDYGNYLQSWDKSAKTKKDFWSSAKQFVKWLTQKELIPRNPFDGLTMTFRSEKFASEQREKWSKKQIHNLLSSHEFRKATPSLRWSILLLIYMGLRPSEACQLMVKDIKSDSGLFTLTITDRGSSQKLKNQHSLRTLPIHRTLIQLGFIDFVREQKKHNKIQLFEWTPTGADNDWTKRFRTQFGKIQTTIKMKSGERPTAYGFRHTFIDDLKQKGIEEYQVAEVVGHANPNMTYGRYGKRLTLMKLREVIERFSLEK
ncbi:site-specific integrase [Vibrio breoganii]